MTSSSPVQVQIFCNLRCNFAILIAYQFLLFAINLSFFLLKLGFKTFNCDSNRLLVIQNTCTPLEKLYWEALVIFWSHVKVIYMYNEYDQGITPLAVCKN